MRPRWARILLAAVRLAAIYAAGVLILLIPLIVRSLREGSIRGAEPWLEWSWIGAVCFGLGFIALAAVKRLGFVVLWGLLVWLWIMTIRNNAAMAFLDTPFVAWTAFAAPLYVLSAVGLSDTARRRWKFEVMVTLLIWATIGMLAFFLGPRGGETLRILDTPYHNTVNARGYLYAAWPFVICARELGRVVGALWRSRGDGTAAAS